MGTINVAMKLQSYDNQQNWNKYSSIKLEHVLFKKNFNKMEKIRLFLCENSLDIAQDDMLVTVAILILTFTRGIFAQITRLCMLYVPIFYFAV